MTQGPATEAGGRRCQLHYFTGRILASQKQKSTHVSSATGGTQANPVTHISSTTVDHHEFYLMDEFGKERSFKTNDLDFPCREDQTASIVWVIPEGAEEGPFIAAYNHNTNDRVTIEPNRIAHIFAKPAWMVWGIALATLVIVSFMINLIVGMIAVLVPFFFFRWQSRQAAKALLANPDFSKLNSQLSQLQPLAITSPVSLPGQKL